MIIVIGIGIIIVIVANMCLLLLLIWVVIVAAAAIVRMRNIILCSSSWTWWQASPTSLYHATCDANNIPLPGKPEGQGQLDPVDEKDED